MRPLDTHVWDITSPCAASEIESCCHLRCTVDRIPPCVILQLLRDILLRRNTERHLGTVENALMAFDRITPTPVNG